MPLAIDWYSELVLVTSPTTSVDAQTLHDFIEDQMHTPEGLSVDDIIKPEGKVDNPADPGVYSQIILIFNSPWQIQFWAGSGYTRIYGGKIVGGLADEPMKATGNAGDITVLESPVDGLTVGGASATPAAIADAVFEESAAGHSGALKDMADSIANLPSDPADQSLLEAAITTAKDEVLTAIGLIPTDAEIAATVWALVLTGSEEAKAILIEARDKAKLAANKLI